MNNNYEYTNPNVTYVNNNNMPLSYHIKRFLIGLILIILLIFLLLWLFPTKAGLKDTIKDSISDAFTETFEEKLNPLYDRIFGDNVNTMKEVATAYFTTDRLPKQDGETIKLTLGEMLDKKLLLSIKDKNGKMCDTDKSYVEVTKTGNEYKMKVNLSCDDEEDYIISYLGCYNYCLNDICEKKTVTQVKENTNTYTNTNTNTNIISRVTKPATKYICTINNGKYYGKNGKVVSKTTYIKECTKTQTKHYCGIYNGKYYGKNGNVVSKSTYTKECTKTPTPEKHYCGIFNGKYYGKNGKVVSKTDYKKQCEQTPEVKHYCVLYNGKYYGKKGNVVTEATYKKECTTPEVKHYCVLYNGKYYGKKGNVVTEATYKKECTSAPEPEIYKYKYEKVVDIKHETEYSKWSNWSGNIEYNPNNNNINWGTHELEINEKLGYKLTKYYVEEADKSQPIFNVTYDKLLGYKTQYACDGYTYYIDSVTNTTYKTTGSATGGWTRSGRITTSSKPSSSNTKKYVYIGMNYDYCTSTCSLKPYYIFDVYTRNAGTATTTSTSSSYSTVSAVCSNVVTKKIPIYGKQSTFAGYVTNKVEKEKKTYYYHRKTRTITQEAWIQRKRYIAWAYSSNEASLINQGYKYTGKYEKIS